MPNARARCERSSRTIKARVASSHACFGVVHLWFCTSRAMAALAITASFTVTTGIVDCLIVTVRMV
jgi:hypothetical protein